MRLKVVSYLCGWLLLLLGLVGLGCRYSTWTWQPAIIAASLSPFLSGAALLGWVLFVLRRRWVETAIATVLVLGLILVQAPRFIADGSTAVGRSLVLLQANLGVGRADPEDLVDRVRTANVDLLTVEELTPSAQDGLIGAGLDKLLPYRFTVPFPGGGAGTGSWSRFPLADQQRHEHFASELLSARFQFGAQPITIYAVHLQPPWPYSPREWQLEFDRLRALMRTRSGVILVSGDFNSGLDNAPFRALTGAGFHDAAAQSGAGALLSYPTDRRPMPALLPLDHLLLRQAQARSARTVGLPGSDHRALLVELVISPT